MITPNNSQLLKDKNVLLIENDEVSQMLLGYMLSKEGAQVDVETDGPKILQYLRDHQVDLILLDTALDNLNALEFTKRMRDEMETHIPIIGMSVTDLRGRGIYNGLDYVLRKPVEYHKFQETLRDFGFSGN